MVRNDTATTPVEERTVTKVHAFRPRGIEPHRDGRLPAGQGLLIAAVLSLLLWAAIALLLL